MEKSRRLAQDVKWDPGLVHTFWERKRQSTRDFLSWGRRSRSHIFFPSPKGLVPKPPTPAFAGDIMDSSTEAPPISRPSPAPTLCLLVSDSHSAGEHVGQTSCRGSDHCLTRSWLTPSPYRPFMQTWTRGQEA